MPVRNRRREQIERTLATELSKRANLLNWRYFGGRGLSPAFCWTTAKITQDGEVGWASYVCKSLDEHTLRAIPESFVLHRTRKAAKARAWNLYQGWRLARGLAPKWRSFA